VQANQGWFRTIEEEGVGRLLNIVAQFLPRIGLSEDAFAQAFCYESTIRFLGNF
jgi:hypothetical protein